MARQRQYWVVSPNVIEQEKTVGDWKKEIRRTRASIMGWSPDDYGHRQLGPKFAGKTAQSVQLGDIILIARRHNWAPDVVGFGVMKGECREEQFSMSDRLVYVRDLEPFIPLKQVPKGIPLLDVLQHTIALRQLRPDPKKETPAGKVCEWMKRRLRLKDQESDSDTTTKRPLCKFNTFGYEVRTSKQVAKAQKREAELLEDYRRWLRKQGRHLWVLKYGRIECDAWEEERQNLIEAKGWTRREDIRMAVGQLFDYAFQGKEEFKQPHNAILLPEEPAPDAVEWLEPLGIKVIWHSGRSFVDNANGQFT